MEDNMQKRQEKAKKKQLPKLTKDNRVSSTGRQIKTPKALLSTSDEEPPHKRNKSSLTAEVTRLKLVLAEVNAKKDLNNNDTAQNFESDSSKSTHTSGDNASNTLSSGMSKYVSKKTAPMSTLSCQGIQSFDPFSELAIANTSKKSENLNSLHLNNTDPIFSQDSNSELNFSLQNHDSVNGTSDSQFCNALFPNRIRGSQMKEKTDQSIIDILKDIKMQLKNIEIQNEKRSTQIEKIIAQNEEIRTQNENILTQNGRILDESSHRGLEETKLAERLYEPLKGFPINTVEGFKELDDILSKEIRKKLYVHLVNLGGSKLREFLNCALKMTLTDELVCKFTWKKSAETEKFGDTRVANVIYQAAKDCVFFAGPTNKAQFTSEMQEILRATKQRFRNSLKKSAPKTPTEEEILERITELEKEIHNSVDESYNEEEEEEFADDEGDP